MRMQDLSPGTTVVVSTTQGDETDEIVRIVGRSSTAGMWLVETARHGRVVVTLGRDGQLTARLDAKA